jgi:hypothetical protein
MLRRTPVLVVLLAFLCAVGVSTTAHADLADRCRIEGLGIDLHNPANGKPTLKFKTYGCPTSNFAFHVKAWCIKGSAPPPWSMCANTTVYDVHGTGNTTFSVPVGNSVWGCVIGPVYTTEAEIWDADTASWVANWSAIDDPSC